ncbi:hypothetical protein BU14_0279s0009 [Porphyra umbilicalis]|uniref:GP-PDE domain-containing protein n=1 Tax=Porphyra umbilicalis TaxID=2786 RepID=A0A1X6P1V9_PORUM|nr:hypothetical protein BU14_0279s0009 [Porphyra umbilicalis]|eukprot:OSX74623.1 hypothetical protein BU14_0279s0009 [Porphyra umbilicalis]
MAPRGLVPLLAAAALAVAAGTLPPPAAAVACARLVATPPPRPVCTAPLTNATAINDAQFLGTHNSYHLAPADSILTLIRGLLGDATANTFTVSQAPLAEQLGPLGVRQLELDVMADPAGGEYAVPKLIGADLLGLVTKAGRGLPPRPAAEVAALREPGPKVLHVRDVDYWATVLTFRAAIAQVASWSASLGRRHSPVAVLVEVIEPRTDIPVIRQPLAWTAADFGALEAAILATVGRANVLIPADVRGAAPTLRAAVTTKGWPTLAAAAGKFLFFLDNGGALRDTYARLPAGGTERLFFTDRADETGHPDAAFVKLNNPSSPAAAARITDAVRAGFLVRTRADRDAVTGDTARRAAALDSGATFVSTDFPGVGRDGYSVSVGGGEGRVNPVRCVPA